MRPTRSPDGLSPPPTGPDLRGSGDSWLRRWWPMLVGACVGVALRWIVFSGEPGQAYAAMMGSFIYLVPLIVGAVTVYVAELRARRSWGYYARAAFTANVLFVVGTLLIMIEGWICAIVIIPLFGLFGIVGGLIMGAVCRITRWPTHTLYGLGLLPMVLGFVETGVPLPKRVETVERSVLIAVPPDVVWGLIHDTRRIDSESIDAWIYRIGAPLPRSVVTEQRGDGYVRRVDMTKQAYFEQDMIERIENRHARWRYRFDPDSFPPGSLDEHVVIGGHYFDMEEGTFDLAPHPQGTRLTMSIRYRLSTQFNWYAAPVARVLMGDLEESVLEYFRSQSEAKPAV